MNSAVANGYAVLNLDRLSLGYSSRPPAAALNLPQDVFSLHQVVTAVRSGALSRFGFGRVVLVGHSYGATVSIPYAGTYSDIAAVVLTGVTHTPGSGVNAFLSGIVPMEQDPVLGQQDYPPGYLTLAPGSFGPLFFHPETSSPSVISTEESIREVFSPNPDGSLVHFFASQGQLVEQRIAVPGDHQDVWGARAHGGDRR